jgi:hypothetical protein
MKYGLYLIAGYALYLGMAFYLRRQRIKTLKKLDARPLISPDASKPGKEFICLYLGNGRSVSGTIDGNVTVVASREQREA